jgi:putative iron-regulated protein
MLAGHELSGERLAVAWETQDQEEEQSCFSDNTCADSLGNALGMRMAWSGTLADVAGTWQGPSLAALVEARSPAAAKALDAAIEASIVAVSSIPAPFDQAVRGDDAAPGRRAVMAAIEALERQADETVAAARTLGVRLDFGPKD